ncbi:hypothetical protein QE363_002023 [Sphingomonas sp. SORGH_AS870]|nr:hypothetical protein [Sphingomonas sp. SORGH_AS_0870]
MAVFEGTGLACKVVPLHQRGGASFPVGLAVDEVAPKLAFEDAETGMIGLNQLPLAGGQIACPSF